MGRKSKIDWREASEEEFDYIKEKYARPMKNIRGHQYICNVFLFYHLGTESVKRLLEK